MFGIQNYSTILTKPPIYTHNNVMQFVKVGKLMINHAINC